MDTQESVCVISESNDYLFLYKPTGVHSIEGKNSESVASWLKEHFPQYATFGRSEGDCGLVQRLDFETAGIITAAKNNSAREKFIEVTEKDLLEKKYLFLSHFLRRESWECHEAIGQQSRGSKRVKTTSQHNDLRGIQEASTKFRLLGAKKIALYEARITAGRRHQIRVHAEASGTPLINDTLYGGALNETISKNFFLFSYQLTSKTLGINLLYLPPITSAFFLMLSQNDLSSSLPD
jgi:23S rRNA pseudouridine1911/1915/1917 synthase